MSIELNTTIIVQAIHFAIAYVIIKFLFFDPVCAQIKDDAILVQERENNLAQARQLVTQKERKTILSWQESQQYFARHTPIVEQSELYVFKNIVPQLHVEPIKSETIYSLVRDVENSLVKKVSHVNHR